MCSGVSKLGSPTCRPITGASTVQTRSMISRIPDRGIRSTWGASAGTASLLKCTVNAERAHRGQRNRRSVPAPHRVRRPPPDPQCERQVDAPPADPCPRTPCGSGRWRSSQQQSAALRLARWLVCFAPRPCAVPEPGSQLSRSLLDGHGHGELAETYRVR